MFRALRSVVFCLAAAVPAVALRVTGVHPSAPLAIVVFGLGVVAASFVLAWAAEAAEVDISGGLAIALLAVIAVLPEYAVDLYFAHTAGSQPAYVAYAAANMTGSNQSSSATTSGARRCPTTMRSRSSSARPRGSETWGPGSILFAWRGRGGAALGRLISAKVNQWTLLIGSLPIAYGIGGGPASLPLDGRQVEEFLLTATQILLGIAVLLTLRFPRWAAWTLLALFAVQFAIPGQTGRYVLSGIYLALIALVLHRRQILPTLAAPFRRAAKAPTEPVGDLVSS